MVWCVYQVLSRAFRNRFVELHFEDIPTEELRIILEQRCGIPPKFCAILTSILVDLQTTRQGTNLFAGKHGFITFRDLFRWAERYKYCQDHHDATADGAFMDHNQVLAADGYMLLAERARHPDERATVRACIEKHLKTKIDLDTLYAVDRSDLYAEYVRQVPAAADPGHPLHPFRRVVWTKGMRRMFAIAVRCLQTCEPVLLVGETGTGKTTICQLLAVLHGATLSIVNCHQNSETSDFIGGLRPTRHVDAGDAVVAPGSNGVSHTTSPTLTPGQDCLEDGLVDATAASPTPTQLFQWYDGPLVEAMKNGDMLLIDEISLADDSVLERLNSVLEPGRSLFLAEKGGGGADAVVAHPAFRIFATMNPGGDFGKKELSPALRNRFTEIWVPAIEDDADLTAIMHDLLDVPWRAVGRAAVEYVSWLKERKYVTPTAVSARDFVTWASFINALAPTLGVHAAWAHGACLVFLDALGTGSSVLARGQTAELRTCIEHLLSKIPADARGTASVSMDALVGTGCELVVQADGTHFGAAPFVVECHTQAVAMGLATPSSAEFSLGAPTSAANAFKVVRAMQLGKPVLLEGSPGVGKTSVVLALARAMGHRICRLNLAEQTDIVDLFGSDLPVEGSVGKFEWRNGPLLQALQEGSWIVLDELNLASQSVLEGLNACLDHRGEVYIPELNKTFKCSPKKFRLFACQNPLHQGGGRKGLPKSFLNRFTRVHTSALTFRDLTIILANKFPDAPAHILEQMISFNDLLNDKIFRQRLFGHGCGDINLRDMFRWCELLQQNHGSGAWDPAAFVDVVYMRRMRKVSDAEHVANVFQQVFGTRPRDFPARAQYRVTPTHVHVGAASLARRIDTEGGSAASGEKLVLCPSRLQHLEAMIHAVQQGWCVNLVGPTSAGKTVLIQLLADLTGNTLRTFSMNSAVDTMDLLGGFEQVDLSRDRQQLWDHVEHAVRTTLSQLLRATHPRAMDALRLVEHSYATLRREVLNTDGVLALQDHADYRLWDALMSSLLKAVNDVSIVPLCSLSVLADELAHLVKVEHKSRSGAFQWRDGLLVDALRDGHWLVVDNVNFCNPSVLDRLNGLLEPGGTLVINERGVIDGTIAEIVPHPAFRLFFTMDPRNGEVSRAMRNRTLEVHVPPMAPRADADVLASQGLAAHAAHVGVMQRAQAVWEKLSTEFGMHPMLWTRSPGI